MARRGRKPDYGRQAAYAKLIAAGVSSAQACRQVGISRRTGKRWRNGYRIVSAGRVLELPAMVGPGTPTPTTTSTPKTYSPRYLCESERIRMADLRREGHSMREVAARMGRSPSTVSRELTRGADTSGRYRPHEAHQRALQRRRVHRRSRLAGDNALRAYVEGKLTSRWSPQQVARSLPERFPEDPARWVCAETIYQAVYRPDLGGLSRELPGRVLRRRRRHRVPRRSAQARRSGPVADKTMIHERDPQVLARGEAGDWEGDLIMGAGNRSAIVTLVERHTRMVLLGHLPDGAHDSATVRDAVVAALGVLPAVLRRTLTWDQGKEMARHREIATALPGTVIFFCEPHSPWQRPSNENANGLLRDYFPKGSDLRVHTAADLLSAQGSMNERPRGVLGWSSPSAVMTNLLESVSVLRR